MADEKYGKGRKVSPAQAREIALAIWARQHKLRDEAGNEKEGALSAMVYKETGRRILSNRNLDKIRKALYDL